MIAGMFHYHYLNFTLFVQKKIGNTEFLKNFKKRNVKKNYILIKKLFKGKNIMSDCKNISVGIINLKLNNIFE